MLSIYQHGPTMNTDNSSVDEARFLAEALKPKAYKTLPRASVQLVTADKSTPNWHHRQMFIRALSFQKEFNDASPMWRYHNLGKGRYGGETDAGTHGYLFTDMKRRVVGACAFRWRKYRDQPGRWILQWVWLAPQFRRMGHLESAWLAFRGHYGDFKIQGPVSLHMQAFLRKHGDEHLM
jgi:hypothetical protein